MTFPITCILIQNSLESNNLLSKTDNNCYPTAFEINPNQKLGSLIEQESRSLHRFFSSPHRPYGFRTRSPINSFLCYKIQCNTYNNWTSLQCLLLRPTHLLSYLGEFFRSIWKTTYYAHKHSRRVNRLSYIWFR